MDESQFKALRELAKDSTLSQRDLSRKVGLSIGRVNYLIRDLLEKGYIKAERFKNSRNKIGYMYTLTPKGVAEKIHQTQAFLARKLGEFEMLGQEIERLKMELGKGQRAKGDSPLS
ncbi:MAG: MarR family EPS-associated transcriptional regulator [Nitrospirota bacterium]|nr:MarR family EPS-associated transcriptional regulator [Nitrospirota bacterium]